MVMATTTALMARQADPHATGPHVAHDCPACLAQWPAIPPYVQIPLFIWANATTFDETTYTSYIAEKPNATRCVEPAVFDNYQMVYTWNLDW
jgi:hypothetical protein